MVCFPVVWAPKEFSLFTCAAAAILAVITLSGNVAVLATIIKDPLKKLRKPFHTFVANLAVSDLIFGLTAMPIATYVHYQGSIGPVEMNWIKAYHLSYFIAATASFLSLLMLSVDRLLVIIYMTKHRIYQHIRRRSLIACGIYVVSVLVPFIYFQLNNNGYLMVYLHLAVIIGLAVIVVNIFRVSRCLEEQRKNMLNNLSKTAPASTIKCYESKETLFKKKIIQTYMLVLSIFVAVYIPALVISYILQFCESCNCISRHVLREFQFLLISSNSCVNPFIYAIRVRAFRQSLKAVFINKRNVPRIN